MQSEISGLQHPLIKHLVKLRQNASYRKSQKTVVVEGLKPITEFCRHTAAKVILTCAPALLPENIRYEKLIVCTESVMQKASGMVSGEGILAEIPQPTPANLEGKKSILVLDGINDPGNLGTLLRTAAALKWDGAVIAGDCCDPYNEKAIRAGRGACLTFPWTRMEWDILKAFAARNRLHPLVADLDGSSPREIPAEQGVMLILGNEARGPSEEALAGSRKISIPLSEKVESLNVAIAGAILMYVIRPTIGTIR